MQYQHDDDWHPTNINNATDDTTTVATSTTMNQGTFEVDQEKNGSTTPTTEAESAFSMEASLSRIDALSQSLSDLTRKRVGPHGHYRAKKRPSIGSTCSGMGTSICSGSSLAIDELASIDSTFLASSTIGGSIDGFSGMSASDMGISRLSLGADDSGSTTSARFGNGQWSLQDMEPWVCSICTYNNEPVFLSCDICGQTKGASSRLHHINAAAAHHSSSYNEQERTRILQEQRMREFQEMQRAAAQADLPPVPTLIEAKRLKRKSKRKSREQRNSSTIPPSTTEESSSPKSNSSSSRRKSPTLATQPQLTNTAPLSPATAPVMEDASLQNVFEFSPAVLKPHRKHDPNESTATERTFDMDHSNFTHNMDASSAMNSSMMDQSYLGQSSTRQWNSTRRSGGSGSGGTSSSSSSKYNKASYRHTQWFEGMDEISDEISV